MSLQAHTSIEGRVASHEGHIVCVANISGDLEDGFLLVSDKAVANGWRCLAVEDVACIGHGEVLKAGRVWEDPGHEVDDLLAVEIDDAEGSALFDFKGMPVAAGNDVRGWLGAV